MWRDKKGEIAGHRIPNFAKFDYEEAPAYHLIDVEKYRSKNNVVAYFKTRGCPLSVLFVRQVILIHHINYLRNTTEKLSTLRRSKFDNLCFRDPTFFLKASVVMDCVELIHNLGVKKKWKGQARGTFHRQYSPEQFKFMKKSGLTSVMFGVESGSQRMLDFMVKKVKREDYVKSAECSRRIRYRNVCFVYVCDAWRNCG